MQQNNKFSEKSEQTEVNKPKKHFGAGMIRGGGIYIALALCILSVICLATYAALRNVFELNTPVTGDNHQIPKPNITDSQAVPSFPTTDMPVNVPNTGETGDDIPVVSVPEDDIVTEEDDTVTPPETTDNTPVYVRTYTKPVNGSIINEFSGDTLVFSTTMNDYRVHLAVDIASTVGEAVKCFSDGIIVSVEDDPLMGMTLRVDHNNGLVSVYSNLSELLPDGIELGSEVTTGQIIAGVGETALIECAMQPHLHFAVLADGTEIDPSAYFH